MGNGIAHVFAQSGYTVSLVDVSQPALEKAVATITKNLDRLLAKERITEADKQSTLSNITTSVSLTEVAPTADLIVEAATENVDLKLKIFKDMDQHAPENCILATS